MFKYVPVLKLHGLEEAYTGRQGVERCVTQQPRTAPCDYCGALTHVRASPCRTRERGPQRQKSSAASALRCWRPRFGELVSEGPPGMSGAEGGAVNLRVYTARRAVSAAPCARQ